MFSRKYTLLLIYIMIVFGAFAQMRNPDTYPPPEYKSYHWDSMPYLHQLSPTEQNMGTIVIKDKRIIEYYPQGDDVVMFITHHMIVRVNSDKAIEEFNSVYIPLTDGVSLEDVQARSITKDGKITVLNPANIKDVDNYENMGHFKIFAIDGIEQGSEVEYVYTLLEPSQKYGTERIRINSLHKNISVDIYSPPSLIFEAKSYNGFPATQTDSSITSKHHIFCKGTDIKGYDHEEYSEGDGALMRMEYKFAYTTQNTIVAERLDTWNDFCQNIYSILSTQLTRRDKKIARKMVDTMKLNKLTEEDKIRKIEERVKTTITPKEEVAGDNTNALENIMKNRVADEFGLLKLYDLLFDYAGIDHEMVLTTNRFDKPFDGSFDSWTYLQKYLIYFPGTDNYIAPAESMSRYGFVPADWICQQGLFMHAVNAGKKINAIAQVQDIACNDWKKSMNDLYENVTFDLDLGIANIHYKETFSGYEGYDIQPYYAALSDQEKQDVVNRLVQLTFEDAKPTHINVSGYNHSEWFIQPFGVEADLTTNTVLEHAGNKYLFKIGELIGPQTELYDDTVRYAPVVNHYNKGYHRELEFEVPDGYKVTNLNAVNMDVYHNTSGERDMEFHSYYTTEGNKVKIIIDEDYRQIRYPISMYEDFRKVINASADFNKIMLFIEK